MIIEGPDGKKYDMPIESAIAQTLISYVELGKEFLKQTEGVTDERVLLRREFTGRVIIAVDKLTKEFEARHKDFQLKNMFGLE